VVPCVNGKTPASAAFCGSRFRLHNLARVCAAMRRNLDASVIMGIDIRAFR
jgi:hypothetical protein